MPIVLPSGGGIGAGVVLFDSILGAPALSIDTGANGIAATANVLDVYLYVRTAEAVVGSTLAIIFNNDSGANYDLERSGGQNVTASAAPTNAGTRINPVVPGASAAANVFGVVVLNIPNYSGTIGNKTGVVAYAIPSQAAATTEVDQIGFGYRSTAAINRMAVSVVAGSNLATGTRLTILGR